MHDARRWRRDAARVERVERWVMADAPGQEAVIDAVALRRVLGELTDVERAALVFRCLDDLPVASVAGLLDRSVEATESILVRARRRLRSALSERAPDA